MGWCNIFLYPLLPIDYYWALRRLLILKLQLASAVFKPCQVGFNSLGVTIVSYNISVDVKYSGNKNPEKSQFQPYMSLSPSNTQLLKVIHIMALNIISTDEWLVAAKHRRSIYTLAGTSSASDSRIEEILRQILSFSPSSYNTQPIRLTLITGEKHKQFWDTIIKTAEPTLKGIGEGIWSTMGELMKGQKAAYGSVRALNCFPFIVSSKHTIDFYILFILHLNWTFLVCFLFANMWVGCLLGKRQYYQWSLRGTQVSCASDSPTRGSRQWYGTDSRLDCLCFRRSGCQSTAYASHSCRRGCAERVLQSAGRLLTKGSLDLWKHFWGSPNNTWKAAI